MQDGIYRYAVSELLSVRIVLREYLAAEVAWGINYHVSRDGVVAGCRRT